MSARALEIFQDDEDLVNWDKYIQHLDEIDGLTVEQKESAKQALEYLRRPEVLGERFLAHARRDKHPFFDYITGITPWTRKMKRLTRFAEAWKSFQGAAGFSESVRDVILKYGRKFAERESVLEIAYKLHNAGLSLSFDPKATVLKRRGFTGRQLPFQTTPDLMAVDNESGEEILIEVSSLTWGDLKESASRTHREIFDLVTHGALFRRELSPRVRINRVLTKEELKEVVARIREAINDAKSSNEFRELIIEGTLEMCLAPWREAERADRWAAERGIKDIPVEGPSYMPYDPVRLKNLIRKEQEDQLPKDKPGIVIITADWSLLFFSKGYGEIISPLEEILNECPNLVGVVVSHTYQSGEEHEFVVTEGSHTFIKRNTNEGLIEETIVSFNVVSQFQVPNSTIEKLRRAFIVAY
jgi:hypothetical protein